MTIGLISDTHGLLRPEALDALAGVDRILHAGDVGDPEILRRLEIIAPVSAVRGNIDKGAWASALRLTVAAEFEGTRFYMVHDIKDLDIDPVSAGFSVVVHGHSHKPRNDEIKGVLYLNPGSAGPRRFKLPITLARLTHADARWRFDLINLV